MGIYKPGWHARAYRLLSSAERATIAAEVDRRFAKKTGIERRLDPSSKGDLELRREWLVIRDEVMEERDEQAMHEMRMDGVLTSIPGEMEYEGWKEGATLLEKWFERPPAIAPGYSAPVTDVITMDWVLKFARAKTVYDQILRERIWTNAASTKRIAEILKAKPRSPGQFGDLSKPVTDVDQEWINARPVANGLALDGMTAALGRFEFQVAVAGKLTSTTGGDFQLSIEEVGIYVKDSFDFNNDDFLGVWGYRDDFVYDDDFRRWRTFNNAGGDFRVFSDIKKTVLTPPEVVKGNL